MGRLTRLSDEGRYYIENDPKLIYLNGNYYGEAIDKLATFENIYDDLLASQVEISKVLETMRNEGKMHSHRFKELMVKKLNNSNTLSLFKTYGL